MFSSSRQAGTAMLNPSHLSDGHLQTTPPATSTIPLLPISLLSFSIVIVIIIIIIIFLFNDVMSFFFLFSVCQVGGGWGLLSCLCTVSARTELSGRVKGLSAGQSGRYFLSASWVAIGLQNYSCSGSSVGPLLLLPVKA